VNADDAGPPSATAASACLEGTRDLICPSFPGRPGGDIDWEPLEDSHYIVYLVKRAYIFVFARTVTSPG
jgi:hypothetical protein